MSLPREMIDELLSGYLDDSLSGDERNRVERMISDQPELASELESLKKQRDELRLLAEQTAASEIVTKHRFAESFPQDVVSAAVQRAREEGCDADHPLLRGDYAKSAVAPKSKGTNWRVVTGVVVTLAASIALVIFAFPKQPEEIKTLIDPDSLTSLDNDPANPDTPFVPPPIVPDINNDESGSPNVMVADAGNDSTNQSPTNPETPNVVSPKVPTPADNMIAAADPKDAAPNDVDVEAMPIAIGNPVKIVPILEIELTQAGRESNAFREALKASSITLGDSRKLTPELVAFVNNDLADQNLAKPEIVLLESLVTNLDLLYLTLYGDPDHVQGIRFGMSNKPPIVSMVNSVRPVDPTKVRHGFGQPIIAPTEQLTTALAKEIGANSTTTPVKNAASAKQTTAAFSEGPNVTMPLLILIR